MTGPETLNERALVMLALGTLRRHFETQLREATRQHKRRARLTRALRCVTTQMLRDRCVFDLRHAAAPFQRAA